jgi:tetratricopeptide (TPR) repeat protein
VGLYHLRRGRADEGKRYLEAVIAAHNNRVNAAAVAGCWLALAAVHLEAGECRVAETALANALAIAREGGNVLLECWILPVLAAGALTWGDREAAARAIDRGFELLTPSEDWRGLPAPLHVARGMLAVHDARWDDAERDFETAVTLNQRYAMPYDEARALHEWGRMHLRRNAVADPEHARRRLGEALSIFKRLGAVGEEHSVTALLPPLRG